MEAFKKRLDEPDMYFGDVPANESNEEAYSKCSNMENAKKYCPKRWEAMQRWFNQARQVSELRTGHLLVGSGANGGGHYFCAEKKWGVNRYYSKKGGGAR